jgi:hypothetical protein
MTEGQRIDPAARRAADRINTVAVRLNRRLEAPIGRVRERWLGRVLKAVQSACHHLLVLVRTVPITGARRPRAARGDRWGTRLATQGGLMVHIRKRIATCLLSAAFVGGAMALAPAAQAQPSGETGIR